MGLPVTLGKTARREYEKAQRGAARRKLARERRLHALEFYESAEGFTYVDVGAEMDVTAHYAREMVKQAQGEREYRNREVAKMGRTTQGEPG